MIRMTLFAAGVSALIVTTTANTSLAQAVTAKQVVAAEGSSGHSHFTKIPVTVPEIWIAIHKKEVELSGREQKETAASSKGDK